VHCGQRLQATRKAQAGGNGKISDGEIGKKGQVSEKLGRVRHKVRSYRLATKRPVRSQPRKSWQRKKPTSIEPKVGDPSSVESVVRVASEGERANNGLIQVKLLPKEKG